MEQLATLVNIGAAGAVIAVVIVFLRFIQQRDKDWRDFFTSIRQLDGETSNKLANVIERLISRVESLENRFDQHDVVEMEILRGIAANLNHKTNPRKT